MRFVWTVRAGVDNTVRGFWRPLCGETCMEMGFLSAFRPFAVRNTHRRTPQGVLGVSTNIGSIARLYQTLPKAVRG